MPPRQAQVRGRGLNQGALVSLLIALANRCVSQPVSAVNAGGAATMKTTVVPSGGMVYFINGVPKLKADLAAQVLTGFNLQNVPANQFSLVRVELDASGTVGMVQGGNFATAAEALANPPSRSANKATICTITLNNGAAVFIPGTTALDVAGVTFTDGDPDLAGIFLPS